MNQPPKKSTLLAAGSVIAWVYVWWPFGRAAHDAFFNYFFDTRLPPQFFPANPLLTVALFLVVGHALVSPIVWVLLGRVFRARAGTLVASGMFAYLFQCILIFIVSNGVKGLWLVGLDLSFFGIWGVINFLLVLGLNLVAAVVAPLVMFVVARAANKS